MESADEQGFEEPSLRVIYQDWHKVGEIFFIIHVCQSRAIETLVFCKPSLCLSACMLPWLPDSYLLTDSTSCLLVSHVGSVLSCLSLLHFTNLRDLLSHFWVSDGPCVAVNGGPEHPLVMVTWRFATHLPLRIVRIGLIFWHNWAPNSHSERVWDGASWVGWLKEGWRDRGGGAGLVGLRVEGWWLAALPRSPKRKRKEKRNNNRKHGLHRLY